ncbi:MAG: hypothetical protein QM756_36120 [Polyangiaceae bacterium]
MAWPKRRNEFSPAFRSKIKARAAKAATSPSAANTSSSVADTELNSRWP